MDGHGLIGAVAQLGERGLCKPEVVGSIPSSSTRSYFFFRVATSAKPGREARSKHLIEGGQPCTGWKMIFGSVDL